MQSASKELSPRTTLNGTSYIERGQGEPVILIHGTGLNADAWSPQIVALAKTYRVIAYDMPDHDGALDTYVAQLAKLLDDLGIKSASLIGHSTGGLVALGFALAHPKRALRVGVLSPVMSDALAGKLGELRIPSLFATGSLDPHSTPDMVKAMVAAVPRSKAFILEGERHMMNRVNAEPVNTALRNLLAEPLTPFEPRELRQAFGTFMTGVTIITTIDGNGNPRGFTANSFTSVSIDPPLLLICIGKNAASRETFSNAPGFAVNILSEKQKIASGIFASKRPDKFADVAWREAESGNPLIDGSVAWFDCTRHDVIDAGDHIILIGAIRAFDHTDANPLGYGRGGYIALGLEQAAVNAVAGGRTVVGAILECQGRLVLARDMETDMLCLPEVGRSGHSGSASLLHEELRRTGIDTDLGFLFAVFENPNTKVQSIYYRGDATLHEGAPYELFRFDALPMDRLPDESTRIMINRYADERRQGRFKIYSGGHERGEVRTYD